MDKRVLLASILSLLVLVTFQYWQTKTAPRPTAPAVMGAAPDQGPADTAPADAPAVAAAPAVQPLPAAAAAPIGREVIVETDLYRAVFTTRGGKLVSLGLKHYLRRKKPPFQAENETRFETLRPDGQPAADLTVLPFELVGSDTMLYRPSTESLLLSKSNPKGELVLQAESGGQPITKRFRFDNDRYGLELEMSGAAAPGLDLGAFSLAPPTSGQKQPEELIFAADGKISRLRAGGRNKNLPLEQKSVLYLARQGQYLLTILKPIETLPARIEADAYGNLGARFRAAGGPGRGNRFYFYSGPSDYQILKREGVGIPEIMPSGPMVALSRFIMSILTFFHRIIPNWGVAIILLTILMKAIFFPLTRISLRTMKTMQKLQPILQDLSKKYRDNPQAMQQEMFGIYRQYRINPMSGCLPMLIQIPIFISMFIMLRTSIVLRGAGFGLWINDLSLPDALFALPLGGRALPLNLLPLIMGVTMFFQQKLSSAGATGPAAQQQKMMMVFMPVMLTVLLYNLPSGLMLYWTVTNLLSIVEQEVATHHLK